MLEAEQFAGESDGDVRECRVIRAKTRTLWHGSLWPSATGTDAASPLSAHSKIVQRLWEHCGIAGVRLRALYRFTFTD